MQEGFLHHREQGGDQGLHPPRCRVVSTCRDTLLCSQPSRRDLCRHHRPDPRLPPHRASMALTRLFTTTIAILSKNTKAAEATSQWMLFYFSFMNKFT